MITHHIAAPLSALDMAVAEAVPPGGNWKDVPTTIPLKRLQTIRDSFARGEGSRSTYYGRLRSDRPSYTINTYFTRPGNGCHLHYDYEGGQHRTLSYREAARLQSFPDSFVFSGNKGDWAKQIGNAVPPLLGFHIANALPATGQTIDLFAGAGGLGLGFGWSGWSSAVANDVVPAFANTYRSMFHERVVQGDISQSSIRDQVIDLARRERDSSVPLAVLGGPPCQGFSTAGKRRSMDDPRNHLFKDYLSILDEAQPDYFVFENVTGLLSMEGGAVYEMISNELSKRCDVLEQWVLPTDKYGVPQRRQRVVLVGHSASSKVDKPTPTNFGVGPKADPGSDFVTVLDALGDLPRLHAGQDGSDLGYYSDPRSAYQRLMRGEISASEFVELASPEEPMIA